MGPSSDMDNSDSDLAKKALKSSSKTVPQVFSEVFVLVLRKSGQKGLAVKGSHGSPVRPQIVWAESHQSADLYKTPTWTRPS